MPESLTRSAFDYSNLDADTAQFLNQQASAIKVLVKQSLENIIEVGKRLIEVKDLLAHGEWMDWLDAEFGWSERTALNYMRVSREFKIENISNLQIANSALYLLAQPSTPEEAREEAVLRAQSGERITVSSTKELLDKYNLSESERKTASDMILERKPQGPQPEVQGPPSEQQSQLQPQPATEFTPRVAPKATTLAPAKRKRAREEKRLLVAPKRVQPKEWWKLGKNNFLYCGEPTSVQFQRLVPESISLSLAFPPTAHWQLDFLDKNVLSSIALHTVYEQDQDLNLLRRSIEHLLEIYTEGEDCVVLSFLPDPAILTLLDELGCTFFCVDPDAKRCDAALTVWTTTGRKAEKMKAQRGKKFLVQAVVR